MMPNFGAREKNCYCHTCRRDLHYLGVARHRTMHREKQEYCKITYTNGTTYVYYFDKPKGA